MLGMLSEVQHEKNSLNISKVVLGKKTTLFLHSHNYNDCHNDDYDQKNHKQAAHFLPGLPLKQEMVKDSETTSINNIGKSETKKVY